MRILIVDDEPETLKGYADFLTPREPMAVRRSSRAKAGEETPAPAGAGPSQSERYNLLLAKSGEEAVDLVKKEMAAGRRVAAGFFDVKLEGGMDGLATISAIKGMDKDIHCVVVTAYHDRSVEEINNLFGEEFKESQVLTIARDANIISGNVFKVMDGKLGIRNSAAHPSDVKVEQLQADYFIDDLVKNVVLKPQ